MAQIFHPSMNTVAKATIFGAVFLLGGLGWVAYAVEKLPLQHGRRHPEEPAGPVQPRAPRPRAGHRLPLLPHVGRGLRTSPASRRPRPA